MARSGRAGRDLVVDLHGYDVVTAVELARSRVAEAYRNGYAHVELLHGAGDVEKPREGGRGRIKWELRRMLEAGEFDAHCVRSESWPRSSSLILTLRRNPRPRPAVWTESPPRTYS